MPPPPPPPGTVGANGGNGTGASTGNGTQSIGGGGTAGGVTFPAPGQPGGAPIKIASGIGGNPLVPLNALPELSTAANVSPLDVILNGNAAADVWSVTGGNLTSIQNNTPGVIVGASVTSVGTISANGSIGLPQGTFGEQVNGASTFSNTYPFNQQHYGVTASSGIVSIKAPRLGNINVGNNGLASLTGEIDGPVVVTGSIGTADISGMIYAGSGAVAFSGIFATRAIGTINATGNIRGDIVSQIGTQAIKLTNNASLINADRHLGQFRIRESPCDGDQVSN